ncbi:MAG TPA: hypothetical protein VNE39_27100 [Planctomycetota bacterium]|nr:hypothetical protein [Planctomycetota bacterium]
MSDELVFPFIPFFSPRFGTLRKPLIPVTVCGPRGIATAKFLLDSGADISIIPRSFGQLIGLSSEGATRAELKGVGSGPLRYHLCSARIRIRHIELPVRIGWCEIEDVPLLLGRLDLFDSLDVEFKQHSNAVILRPVRT